MYRDRLDEQYLRLLLVQLRKRSESLIIGIPGSLTQKQTRIAGTITDHIEHYLESKLDQYKWQIIKNARVGVSFHFRSNNEQTPSLPKLVKFYLDLLQKRVFENDRQVGYLEATCTRFIPQGENRQDNDHVFIKVERLADCQKRFDLYFSLLAIDEFRTFLNDRSNEKSSDSYSTNQDILSVAYILSEAQRQKIFQEFELSINEITRFDRPGGLKHNIFQIEQVYSHTFMPFTVELGGLPRKGESKQFRQRIEDSVKQLRASFIAHQQVEVPVELDVRVIPRRGATPEKDLDNIILEYIAPALQQELFSRHAYIHGYRIYIARNYSETPTSGSIRVKLLGENAIYKFHDKMEQTFKIADNWIAKKL